MAGNVYILPYDFITDTNEPPQGDPGFSNPTIGYYRSPNEVTEGVWEADVSLTGSFNTSVGSQAGAVRTTGDRNIDIGYQSGPAVDFDGSDNISIGYLAGTAKTAGDDNIYIGNNGSSLTTESDTIRIGTVGTHANTYIAGDSITFGDGTNIKLTSTETFLQGNVYIDGFKYIKSFERGQNRDTNLSIGKNSMDEDSSAGPASGPATTVMVGPNAGFFITEGQRNTGLGHNAMFNASSFTQDNTCIGASSGSGLVSGISNTVIGALANAVGSDSVVIGKSAGSNNSGGDSNIYIGSSGPASTSTESDTIRIGTPGTHTDSFIAGNQVTFGNAATSGSITLTTDVSQSLSMGYNMGINPNANNVFLGYAAGQYITATGNNVVVGALAGAAFNNQYNSGIGGNHTIIGYNAGYGSGSGVDYSFNCIMIGANAGNGKGTFRKDCIFIGHSGSPGAGSLPGQTKINNESVGKDTYLYGALHIDPGATGTESSIEMEKPDTTKNIVTMTDNNTLSTQLGDQVTGSFTDLDLTPDVSSNSAVYIASYSSPSILTSFDSLTEGQRFTIHTSGANVSVGHFTEIQLSNSSVFNMQAGDTLSLVADSPTVVRETGRTYGTAPVVGTFADQDATPTVGLYPNQSVFQTSNTVLTTYTDFDDGVVGETITVIVNDALSVFDFTASSLKGNGGVDWIPASGDHLSATYNGISWYCDVSEN
jgi:hypothetical protein